MKKRKIPLRRCVASGEMRPKKELFRIVRTPGGEVLYDPSGKRSGRGTYVSKNRESIEKAKKNRILEKHLNASVEEEVYNELFRMVEREKLK